VALAVAPELGVGSTHAVQAWGLRGYARVEYAVAAYLSLGLGVGAREIWATASGASPSQQEGVTASALVSAAYTLALGPVRFAIGPRLEALARPVVVDLGTTEVFRVPTWIGAVAITAEAP
jgi:hypothetical protein